MIYGSVCSGIEAASCAWEGLGWSAAWFSEAAPFPSAVIAAHWPQVQNLGDMTRIAQAIASGAVEAPDVLVGGTPCQSFSIYGLRKGLNDPRGQLTMSYVEILDAIDEKRRARGERECIAVWENVPGVLNDDENAFGCFTAALAGEDDPFEPGERPEPGKSNIYWRWNKKAGQHIACWPKSGCVYGPRRRIAWRVINAECFGVPQRRRRVFVIASARNDIDPAQILLEFDRGERNVAPRRQAEEKLPSPNDERATKYSEQELIACFGGGNCSGPLRVSTTLTAHGYRLDYDVETFVVHQLRDDRGEPFSGVRRLMPVEVERLQGFPDNWTQVPYQGKPADQCKDAPRYKAVGNSMAVPVMRRLGEWIQREVDYAQKESDGKACNFDSAGSTAGDASAVHCGPANFVELTGEGKQRPFLKWAGGKFSVLEELAKYLPSGQRLIEPFVGAGSVFMNFNYPAYLLGDINDDLINLYRQLAANPDSVIKAARELIEGCVTDEHFLKIRDEFNARQAHAVRHAALFLTINRTCFNGLTRYNNKGLFNVGWNKKPGNAYFPEAELNSFASRRAHYAFVCASFTETIMQAGAGDVVYCDPPYEPLPGKNGFVKYDKGGFKFDSQTLLTDELVKAHQRGARVVITNSCAPEIIDLYESRGFKVHEIKARRSISCKGETREQASDIIATL